MTRSAGRLGRIPGKTRQRTEKSMSAQPNLRTANIKMAVNVFFRTVFSAIMAMILYMSLMMIVTGLSTETIGERLVEYDEEAGTTTILSEIYYDETTTAPSTTQTTTASTQAEGGGAVSTGTGESSGEATDTATTSAATTTTLPSNQQWQAIRSEVPAGAQLAFDIVAQILMFILLAALPYSKLWMQGDKDSNMVQFGHMQEDKFRGLKVGLMAGIPSYLVYIMLILSKLGLVYPEFIFIYRLLNFSFLPLMNRLTGTAVQTTLDVSWPAILALVLTVVAVPIICWLGYLLGYKHISLSEKFVYVNPQKKKKRRR